ncbi:tannase/feruloyl esterase family alpha/beta hydrolase [Acetobacteraceae bacterium H6797]|nr:tannase/feruloyl esterase family alpha/beta hydrolase [Acetobacteraceae bacterium H6797]
MTHKTMLLLATAGLLAAPAAFAAETPPAGGACAALGKIASDGLRITRAEAIPAGTLPADNPARAALTGAARASAALPAHCLIEGSLDERQGTGGKPYAVKFQLRLPENWNGRFLFQGGGGMDGVVNEAIGAIPVAGATAPPALNRGFAVVSTDSGHQGRDSRDADFGLDQQARLDYAYAAIGKVTEAAKALIIARYGRAADRSYFMGCSNGGRAAMMAAQRFPDEFDGIVAGNPGFRLSRAASGHAWDVNVMTGIAPRAEDGRPVLANAFTPAEMKLVTEAVLQQCDAKDGLKDGLLTAPSTCHFDPAALRCQPGQTEACLPEAKLTALVSIMEGGTDSRGEHIYSSWPWDAGLASAGWRAWKLGTSQTGQPNSLYATLTPSSLGLYFMTPPVQNLQLATIDFDKLPARTAQTAAINDTTGTMYTSFTAHGGRMLVFHGNSDPAFSADDLRAYWKQLQADNDGDTATWARLFMVPGMNHCGGGPATDDFDPLTAIQAWVEKGEAPATLIAKGASFPGRTRPLCAYPQEAYYKGEGDPESAASFVCR